MIETLRRIGRGTLGYDSALYRGASLATDFVATVTKEGFQTWKALRRLHNTPIDKPDTAFPITLKTLHHPLWLRPGTRDAETVISTVIRGEYDHCCLPEEPRWMIDAGAYIGDTAAFFLSRYPRLRVIALEPGEDSVAAAHRNLTPYGERVQILPMGLWGEDGALQFSGDSTGASIGGSDGRQIDVISVPTLMERFSITHIDILKMDIEGAEASVFSHEPQEWLAKVGTIMMEIHGTHLEQTIPSMLVEHGFSIRRHRSVWCCRRLGV